MSSYKTEVQNLHYDAASQCFHALVVMYEGGDTVKYPTSLQLPIQSEFDFVSRKLVSQAKKQRARKGSHLVSRSPTGQSRLTHLGDLARKLSNNFSLDTRPHAA